VGYADDSTIIVDFCIHNFIPDTISCCAVERYPKLNLVIHDDVLVTLETVAILRFKITTNIIEAKLFMHKA
jgi:hypothetical protein